MKEKELVIGDWVLCNDEAFRIGDWINWEGDIADIENDENFGMFEMSKMKPIPITSEILEKNGFLWNEERNLFESQYFDLRHIINTTWAVGDTMMRLDSVHELQHALTLCKSKEEIVL